MADRHVAQLKKIGGLYLGMAAALVIVALIMLLLWLQPTWASLLVLALGLGAGGLARRGVDLVRTQ